MSTDNSRLAVDYNQPVATVMNIDANDSAFEVVYTLCLERFVKGDHPFSGATVLHCRVELDEALPHDFSITRQAHNADRTVTHAEDKRGDLVMLVDQGLSHTWVRVTGADRTRVFTELDQLRALGKRHQPDEVAFEFWHLSGRSPASFTDRRQAVQWASIWRNYPIGTRDLLDKVMKLSRPRGRGQLILWRGGPGTGKTFAIRALAHAWSNWATTHVLLDGERFFDSPDYARELIYNDSNESMWKLVVAEDADEYLQTAGGRRSGAALARLLNLGEGLFGEDARLLILLTTNVPGVAEMALRVTTSGSRLIREARLGERQGFLKAL